MVSLSAFPLLVLAAFPWGRASGEVLSPQVAGSFYPAEPERLRETVEGLLRGVPASTAPAPGKVWGILVPHAGYVFSGPTAARAHALLRGKSVRTLYILATGHRRAVRGAATLASGVFRTPLGEVEVDTAAVSRLLAATSLVEPVPEAFVGEHAVEVQLPFLQAVLKPGFRVVPLLMNTDDLRTGLEVGRAVAGLLKPGRDLLVVSSDLSHYPPAETARAVDRASLASLVEPPQEPETFWRTNRLLMARGGRGLDTTWCGEAAVLSGHRAMRALGAKAHLLAYTHSGETEHGDPSRVVGYAALAWAPSRVSPVPRPLDKARRSRLLALGRAALEARLGKGKEPKARLWDDEILAQPGAVFVTLRVKGLPRESSLRGCIGSLVPELPLGEAVEVFAVKSALEDGRFSPVRPEEVAGLSIEVSRLSPFRKVPSAAEVRPGQGVVVRRGARAGLFLPQVWEDLPDQTRFLGELCSQKAGLERECWKDPETAFEVFDAEAFEEP